MGRVLGPARSFRTNAAIEQTEAQAVELDRVVAIFTIDTATSGSRMATVERDLKALQRKTRSAA